ncbi:MAG: hypothetical protein CL843_08905 [Crocinitomicaceae bacterium]|nr:hypothetical protein [Crocinitomicaceae bacterium]|tara:strand:- start:3449 stop:4054 length:606 start_codon:yes stop_codon:yes gene_type:complete
MSFVNRILEKIIPPRNEPGSSYQPPVLSEKLVRSKSFIDEYDGWVTSNACRPPLTLIKNAYEFKKIGADSHVNLHIFNSKQSNGFYFTKNNSFGKNEFPFLFDLFKDRVLELSYYLYTSKLEVNDRPDHVQTVEMHYLKPVNPKQKFDISSQEYGNIVIEHVLIDNESSYIKLMANVYSDSKYYDPKSFDELMNHLLATGG